MYNPCMPVHDKQRPAGLKRLLDPRSLPFSPGRCRGDLPHLEKEGCTYFVTFCLHDAVPSREQRRPTIDKSTNADDVAHRSEPATSKGTCTLQRREIAAIVEGALLHFNTERYALHAWTVMPNHVHVVVTPFDAHTLSTILHSWKSFTAHKINKTLGRCGPVWESESFDHLIRDLLSFERFVLYTENNPVAAGLCRESGEWRFGSARLRSPGEER